MEAIIWASDMKTTFRRQNRRSGILIHGSAGWAEFSPFANYSDEVAARWLQAALEAAWAPYPPVHRTEIEVNVTVPACEAQLAYEIAQHGGCKTAKVKVAEVGQTLTQDIQRLEAVRDALGSSAKIRIDANGAWDVEQACFALKQLDKAAGGLEYVEQPCASVAEIAQVRRRQQVPVAADESIRLVDDPYRVVKAQAADVLVIKVQPLGGVRRCLRLVEELQMPVVVSSALESSVGIAMGLALAGALPSLDYACGLATVDLIKNDVVEEPLLPQAGKLPVMRPEVTADKIQFAKPTVAEIKYWKARFEACARITEIPGVMWIEPEQIVD